MKPGDLVISKKTGTHGIILSVSSETIFAEPLSYPPERLVRVLFNGMTTTESTMSSSLKKVNP